MPAEPQIAVAPDRQRENASLIRLDFEDLQWVRGTEDEPDDQCAHGRVRLEINGTDFARPDDGIWTVSAAGLYLLRSLSDDHTAANPIAESNLLFPHCGFTVWVIGRRYPVLIMGCNNGVDLELTHSQGIVTVRSAAGAESVSLESWRRAVVSVATRVKEFYATCSAKVPSTDDSDLQGWAAFWREWDERLSSATH
jgi:hypothetical protein